MKTEGIVLGVMEVATPLGGAWDRDDLIEFAV